MPGLILCYLLGFLHALLIAHRASECKAPPMHEIEKELWRQFGRDEYISNNIPTGDYFYVGGRYLRLPKSPEGE